jgi:hypothetical protein
VATNDDGLVSEIVTSEAKVVGAEGAVTADDLTEVTSDPAVEADLVVGVATEIAAEAVQARVPLLEDDGLSLNLADLLGDDPLGHLLENDQALLNDFNTLSAADELVLLLYNDLVVVGTIKVFGAIEVVKVVQGSMTTPVVEGGECADSKFKLGPESDRASKG